MQLARILGVVVVAVALAGVLLAVKQDPPEQPARPAVISTPQDLYDPVRAGEKVPVGYRPVLRRDVIAPIYDPTFVAAAAAEWDDDTLVVGVAIDGEAKAYPVSHLNRREMVIDRIAGIPILVTW